MSHPYRRTFVTQDCMHRWRKHVCAIRACVLGSNSPLSVARSDRDDRRVMELQGKGVVTVSYEHPWELFPSSPFAHSWVCGWQWPGHVLTPKGPAPAACRAHTCSLSGIYRPDTRSRLPLAYGQTCHSTVPRHWSQEMPYHSYQGARVYATSA